MKKILFCALLFSGAALGGEFSGKVISISDGDTLTVLNEQNQQVKIRMAEIDAPEKAQDFGDKSKQSLADMCFNKAAVIDSKGTDRYQRTLGRVYCDGVDVNAEQVKRGMAWVYRQYSTDEKFIALENDAKSQKIGLWQTSKPVPPWEFRHNKHNAATGDELTVKEPSLTDIKASIDKSSNDYQSSGSSSSHGYFTGPRGGCFTYTSSGRKRYVAHSFCGR